MFLTTLTTTLENTLTTLFFLALLSSTYDTILASTIPNHTAYTHHQHHRKRSNDVETPSAPKPPPRRFETLLSLPIFLAMQYGITNAASLLAHYLIHAFASQQVRFWCKRDSIRGFDCGAAVEIQVVVNVMYCVGLLVLVRGMGLHCGGRVGKLYRLLGVVLGVPAGVVCVHYHAARRTLVRRLGLLAAQGVGSVMVVGVGMVLRMFVL